MRKRGAQRVKRLTGHLLLPEQVAKYVTPLHTGLVLLPLGLFGKDNADHLAMVINLVSVDAAGSGSGMFDVAENVAAVLRTMFARTKAGKSWGVTSEEREILRKGIVMFDRYIRTWTSDRMLIAATTIADHNEYCKARGGKFLDWVPLNEKEAA